MNTTLSGRAGQTLLDCLRLAEHPLRAPCAGRGTCGKCRVVVPDATALAPAQAVEIGHLGDAERAAGVRLACLAVFAWDGEVQVRFGDDGVASPAESLAISVDQPTRDGALASGRALRVAVDVGTTTVAVCLCDVVTSTVLSVRTAANAQKSWGSDVVARIQAVIDDPGCLAAQQKVILQQIQGLVTEQVAAARRSLDELDLVVVAGNTVMLHLLTGTDPSGMARVPFTPAFLEARTVAAPEFGLPFPGCRATLLPGISPFVGADITAGVLSTRLWQAESTQLLLDIGTNGEMVLGSRHGMVATATAAGPAFEGAQIAHGSPGIPGALDHAGYGQEGFWYTTIADQPLTGICGSGLLDLVATLRRGGQLDETGFLELPDADEFFPDPDLPVSLSQADIRQLQLAKGAIAAGVEILCLKAGVTMESVEKVHLAGGFGTFLTPSSALAIGLLPQGLRGKIVPVGNTALKGALEVLSRSDALTLASRLAQQIQSVDLSTEAAFQMAFAEAMLFPEDVGDDAD